MKLLKVEHCKQCYHSEVNMYHGFCCWHKDVCKPRKDGRTPRKIKYKNEDYFKPQIPEWCPLEDFNESK